jgi:hypothetical protein
MRYSSITPPPITPELIQWLSEVFPNECPSKQATNREVWIAVGNNEVVQHLIDTHELQKQSGPTGFPT